MGGGAGKVGNIRFSVALCSRKLWPGVVSHNRGMVPCVESALVLIDLQWSLFFTVSPGHALSYTMCLLFLLTPQLPILSFIFQSRASSHPLDFFCELAVLSCQYPAWSPPFLSRENSTEYNTHLRSQFAGTLQKFTTFLANLVGALRLGKINRRFSLSILNFTAVWLTNSPILTFLQAVVDNLENNLFRENKDFQKFHFQ